MTPWERSDVAAAVAAAGPCDPPAGMTPSLFPDDPAAGGRLYFGVKWDAPATDDGRWHPTPVGEMCIDCETPVQDGDRGYLIGHTADNGLPTLVPIHLECEVSSTVGHVLGACHCTMDVSTPAARRTVALVAWERLLGGGLNAGNG